MPPLQQQQIRGPSPVVKAAIPATTAKCLPDAPRSSYREDVAGSKQLTGSSSAGSSPGSSSAGSSSGSSSAGSSFCRSYGSSTSSSFCGSSGSLTSSSFYGSEAGSSSCGSEASSSFCELSRACPLLPRAAPWVSSLLFSVMGFPLRRVLGRTDRVHSQPCHGQIHSREFLSFPDNSRTSPDEGTHVPPNSLFSPPAPPFSDNTGPSAHA
nr:uncharacterized serine-rich protein C215.13-like [Penaeus vannamei]